MPYEPETALEDLPAELSYAGMEQYGPVKD